MFVAIHCTCNGKYQINYLSTSHCGGRVNEISAKADTSTNLAYNWFHRDSSDLLLDWSRLHVIYGNLNQIQVRSNVYTPPPQHHLSIYENSKPWTWVEFGSDASREKRCTSSLLSVWRLRQLHIRLEQDASMLMNGHLDGSKKLPHAQNRTSFVSSVFTFLYYGHSMERATTFLSWSLCLHSLKRDST